MSIMYSFRVHSKSPTNKSPINISGHKHHYAYNLARIIEVHIINSQTFSSLLQRNTHNMSYINSFSK